MKAKNRYNAIVEEKIVEENIVHGFIVNVNRGNQEIKGFVPKSWTIERHNYKLKVEEEIYVIFIEEPSDKDKLPVYGEAFNYNVDDKISLKFIKDYTRKKTKYRIVYDKKNRIIHSKRKIWQKGENYFKPQIDQDIKYQVINLSKRYYPIIHEIGHPFKKGEFQKGQELTLYHVEEYDKNEGDNLVGHRILRDELGRQYDTYRSVWQQGPEYTPPKKGEKILYKVKQVTEDGYPICEEADSVNPYFKKIDELPGKNGRRSIKKLCFSTKPENKRYEEIFYLMHADYKNENGNWILSFTKILKHEIYKTLDRRDFKEATSICRLYEKIGKYIKTKGLLLSYTSKIRKEISNNIDNAIHEVVEIQNFCKIANKSTKLKEKLNNLYRLPKNELYTLETKISINMFLRHFNSFVDNKKVEKLYSQLMNGGNERFVFENFCGALMSRKDKIRTQLFSGTRLIDYKCLEKNKDLRHLIFIMGILSKKLVFNRNLTELQLQQSCIQRFIAYYETDKRIKIKHINNSINLLDNKFPNDHFNTQKEFYKWQKRICIEKALDYELWALQVNDLGKKIVILNKADKFYGKARNAKSYLISELKNYYILKKSFKDNLNLDKIIKISTKMLNKLEKNIEKTRTNFPIAESLFKLYKIISLIKDNSEESREFLYFIICEHSVENNILPNLNQLSKIVLAYNFITEISDDEYDLSSLIEQYFIHNSLNLNKVIGTKYKEDLKLAKIIFGEENTKIEFKGSFEFDVDRYCATNKRYKSDHVLHSVLKTIVGMLNAKGGKIYVGVLEKNKLKGKNAAEKLIKDFSAIEKDGKLILGAKPLIGNRNWSLDELILNFQEKVKCKIGDVVKSNYEYKYKDFENKKIIEVEITPIYDPDGIWLEDKNKEKTLYVRQSNQTNSKKGKAAMKYLRMRMNRYK